MDGLIVMNYYLSLFFIFLYNIGAILGESVKLQSMEQETMQQAFMKHTLEDELNPIVYKKVLSNGLTILVKPSGSVPKVSIQLWYQVGSKDEELGEKGIAHLIEHMVFKITKSRGETDLDAIVHKLSGSCNAFTSYDYTGYLFEMPSCQFEAVFSIMADCMENVLFDDQMLNSEMKAVIQELKMNKDRYVSQLLEGLLAAIFFDHPYHYPIIGFKQDLWSVNAADLTNFYKKHYGPNNATLVIVGDVEPEKVFALAESHFGSIKPLANYQKNDFFHTEDVVSRSITLYRDIQLPMHLFAFVIPGLKEKLEHIAELAEWIIGKGNGSRLYKRLVNDLQYVTSLEVGSWALFDHGLFFICCDPVDGVSKEQIRQVIIDEIHALVESGISDAEFLRAYKKAQSSFYSLLESTEDQAYTLGQSFLATGDHDYLFTCMNQPLEKLKNQVQTLISRYLRFTVMHDGSLLALPHSEKKIWSAIQDLSDSQDSEILSLRIRTIPVLPPSDAANIAIKSPSLFVYPHYNELLMDNGIKILYCQNDTVPKISLVISFKAQSHYDPEDKQGIYNFIAALMTEKTVRFTADQLADFIESKGISLNVYPGCILLTCLKDDLEAGLDIIHEVVTSAQFDFEDIEKIRTQLVADLKNYWDDPRSFAGYLVRKKIYKGHPYAKNLLGSLESLHSITRDDLVEYYKKFITPDKTRIAIVGDIKGYNLQTLFESKLGDWKGSTALSIEYPVVCNQEESQEKYLINRDQVVLCFAKPSIDRFDKRYDALLIFDQILVLVCCIRCTRVFLCFVSNLDFFIRLMVHFYQMLMSKEECFLSKQLFLLID
jgi:zinc protease